MNLLDLPNEILLIIFKYLSTIDVFRSFVGISERLERLVTHPMSTRTVNMACLRLELLPKRIYSLDQAALAALCRDVLPRIHHHIRQLVVDQFTIDAVFRAAHYCELRSLSVVGIDEAYAVDFLRGKTTLASCSVDERELRRPTHASAHSAIIGS